MKNILLTFVIAATFCACSHNTKFDAAGNFEATEITVSAEAAGRILSLNVEEGDTIAAGATIGAIDSVQLYLTKLQLQKNVKSVAVSRPNISKQIAAINEQIAKQNTELRRVQNLLQSGAATQKQLDDITSNIRVLEGQRAAQQSSLQNSTASLNAQSSAIDIQIAQAEDKLAKCRITSPANGTVLAKYAEAGELTAIGKPLFKIADLNKIYLRAYVTSAQLANLKIGQNVKVSAQFGGENSRAYDGKIAWISAQSEFTPKNIQTNDDRSDMVYAIKISVENDGYIKIGTYGEVNF